MTNSLQDPAVSKTPDRLREAAKGSRWKLRMRLPLAAIKIALGNSGSELSFPRKIVFQSQRPFYVTLGRRFTEGTSHTQ